MRTGIAAEYGIMAEAPPAAPPPAPASTGTDDLPADIEAERSALGCVLNASPEAAPAMLRELDATLFDAPEDRAVFDALQAIAKDGPITLLRLVEYLRAHNCTERAGGEAAIIALADAGGTASPELNFPEFLKRLRDLATRRAAISDARMLIAAASKPDCTPETVGDAARRLLEAHSARNGKSELTLRRPAELLEMEFDESDNILGDRLLAKGQPLVIAGAGGLGKSRLITQLAACQTTGRKFLVWDTLGEPLRWLILQTENSNRRFQKDLAHLRAWLGDDWERFNERVLIHTIENDLDSILNLDSPENQQRIENAIQAVKPDVVCFDPLNDFACGDLNKDGDMRLTVQALGRTARKGNPERALVLAHHALTGKAGAAKATGFDRSSFARNSKLLYAWTRAQINLAPVDPDSNDRLIVSCGKCSNGREFLPFGIRLNPESMVYEPDASIDVKAWEGAVTGQADREPLMTPERVRELCRPAMSKAELARAIRDDCGCARQVAYRHIRKAEIARLIKWNHHAAHYNPR